MNNQFLYTRETFPGSWAQARLKSRCENWALTAWLLVDEELQKHQEGSPEFILLKRVLDRIDMNLPVDPPPSHESPSFNPEWTQDQIEKSKRSVINNALDMLRTLYGDLVCTKEEFGNMLSDTGYAREYLSNSSYQLELWCYFQGTWMNEIPE